MFIAFRASLNGFMLGCGKMLFVGGTHLGGLYEKTMLVAIVLDIGNHLLTLHMK